MELSAGFVLDAAAVRVVKRAEARAPAANSVTRRFVRSSICRMFLRISRGIMGQEILQLCDRFGPSAMPFATAKGCLWTPDQLRNDSWTPRHFSRNQRLQI